LTGGVISRKKDFIPEIFITTSFNCHSGGLPEAGVLLGGKKVRKFPEPEPWHMPAES
jgi:hypothetical protein